MLKIKSIAKRTPLYSLVQRRRIRKAHSIWTENDQKMLAFYAQFISKSDLCFDVGANIGNRTKIFLKLGAKVVAVEPQPECAQTIQLAYGNQRKLRVVQKALGEAEGEAQMMISHQNELSSFSSEWVQAVRTSGRFSHIEWIKTQNVQITTLDELIKQYGVPRFIKIDVEGFEYPVIKGLSKPVNCISLEFTPEIIESSIKCIEHLQQLGSVLLNYSIGESMQLALDQWVSSQAISEILNGFRDDHTIFGDLYIRFV